jgi:hypothetical protein
MALRAIDIVTSMVGISGGGGTNGAMLVGMLSLEPTFTLDFFSLPCFLFAASLGSGGGFGT